MQIKTFFDKDTFTLTYIVWDEKTKQAVIIDPVLNYEPCSSKISKESVNHVCDFLKQEKIDLLYILETHAHADHLSGAQHIKKQYPHSKICIGENITKVQTVFKDVFNFTDLPTDGSQFDILLSENTVLKVGDLSIKVIFTPGHTPACASYLIEDALFTGDALFMPDYGTGRCDFPLGSAENLYDSVTQKIYTLPEKTRVFVGHDYLPNGRELAYESTVAQQKEQNIQLNVQTSKEEFIRFRNGRDSTLAPPRLLLSSIQTNIRAGHFADPEENGTSYLKIPLRG